MTTYQRFCAAILLVSVVVFLVAACETTYPKEPDKVQQAIDSLSYGKDAKTGLCFAMLTSSTYSGYLVTAITNVPCR